MGYLAMARGNEKEAVPRFEKALQIDPAYVPALVGKGRALLELERVAEALASFEAALAKDPSADRPAQPGRSLAIPSHASHAGARQRPRPMRSDGMLRRPRISRRSPRRRIRHFCIGSWPAVEQRAGQTV